MTSRKSLTHLIEQAKQGHTEDLDELLMRFQPLILKLVKRMNVEYREDAKQELIMELIEAIQRFEPKTNWGKEELKRHIEKHKTPN